MDAMITGRRRRDGKQATNKIISHARMAPRKLYQMLDQSLAKFPLFGHMNRQHVTLTSQTFELRRYVHCLLELVVAVPLSVLAQHTVRAHMHACTHARTHSCKQAHITVRATATASDRTFASYISCATRALRFIVVPGSQGVGLQYLANVKAPHGECEPIATVADECSDRWRPRCVAASRGYHGLGCISDDCGRSTLSTLSRWRACACAAHASRFHMSLLSETHGV